MTDSSPSTTAVQIRPGVTVLSVFRHLNYKPWFAIAEFVDNAIQSYFANEAAILALHGPEFKLKVSVELSTEEPGMITITDNAAGISLIDFPRAFRAAQVPTDRSGLSEFGMGMKSAACWFSPLWSVRTKALGETVERTVLFNLKHIVDNQLESLEPTIHAAKPSDHYTVVTLQELSHMPVGRTIGKIKDHLSSIYRVFLRNAQLVLEVNGTPLSYQTPAILHAVAAGSTGPAEDGSAEEVVEWRKEIEFDFGLGKRISGFAALREKGSTQMAGFALLRRNRLIEGSHDEAYRPAAIFKQSNSFIYQRLFGELHLEGFEVSHTKDGFKWDDDEETVLELLKAALVAPGLNLLMQAENYRAQPKKSDIAADASRATSAVVEYVAESVAPLLMAVQASAPVIPALPAEVVATSLQASEQTITVTNGKYDWEITVRTSVDPAKQKWLEISQDDSSHDDGSVKRRRLTLDLSLAHPFSTRFIGAHNENIELLLQVSTAVSIAFVLASDLTGQPPSTALHFLNNILRGEFKSARHKQ